jgi:hypothetical protein
MTGILLGLLVAAAVGLFVYYFLIGDDDGPGVE